MNTEYRALVTEERDGKFETSIKKCFTANLPEGDLLIRVLYSSLNYKDALSANGNRGITKNYPHTPGIDAAGIIEESFSPDFREGEEVFITGYDFGMNTPGGFGEYVRVPSEWVLRLPEGLGMKEVMILGTAGLTAGLSVYMLGRLVKPGDGLIAVSGATGGVGSISLSILASGGYKTAAVTGKADQSEYFKMLGCHHIIHRDELARGSEKPMLTARFAGAIDSIGGPVLENIIKSIMPMGAVTCCGNAASAQLNLTVYPFILRGISLTGIDSQNCSRELRKIIWKKLASEWKPFKLLEQYNEIKLEELNSYMKMMLDGKIKGRIIIKHEF